MPACRAHGCVLIPFQNSVFWGSKNAVGFIRSAPPFVNARLSHNPTPYFLHHITSPPAGMKLSWYCGAVLGWFRLGFKKFVRVIRQEEFHDLYHSVSPEPVTKWLFSYHQCISYPSLSGRRRLDGYYIKGRYSPMHIGLTLTPSMRGFCEQKRPSEWLAPVIPVCCSRLPSQWEEAAKREREREIER